MEEGYDEEEEARLVLREVAELTGAGRSGGGKYKLGEIAVMYRVNAQSRAARRGLPSLWLSPYQLVGGTKFYHREEVKDVAAYLRLLANPNDDVSLNRILNKPRRAIGDRTRDELTRLARNNGTSMYEAILNISPSQSLGGPLVSGPFTTRAARALGDFRELIEPMRAKLNDLNIVDLVEFVIESSGYRKFLLDRDEQAEERIDNINEFKSAAREFISLQMPDALTAFLESVSLVSDVDGMDEEPERLTLITLHQAKGLEYPVVFMVGMEDGLLPHSRSLDEEASLEEERRICYVGMTRAKDKLYLTRAFRRGFRGGTGPNLPSRFLLDIPTELIATGEPDTEPSVAAERPSRSVRPGARRNGDGDRGGFQFTRRGRRTDTPETGRTQRRRPERPVGRPMAQPSSRPGEVPRGRGRTATPQTRRVRRQSRRSPAVAGPPFSVGDKVRHEAFGDGIVTACEPSGADFQATVAFKDGGGVKRFLTSLAPLRKAELTTSKRPLAPLLA